MNMISYETRPAYTLGEIKTDLPDGAVRLHSSEEEYCPESGRTSVYEVWECLN